MNAAIRGYQNIKIEGKDPKKDQPNDYYATPAKVCHMAFKILRRIANPRLPHGLNLALDVGAGTGIWGKILHDFNPLYSVDGIEIDPRFAHPSQYRKWFKRDLRRTYKYDRYKLVFGNPPYGLTNGERDNHLTEKAIRLGWDLLAPNGWMVYLLKSVFAEGEERGADLFQDIRPTRIMISSARIPFRPEKHGKNTNTVSYALYYWRKDHLGNCDTSTDLGWFNHKKDTFIL